MKEVVVTNYYFTLHKSDNKRDTVKDITFLNSRRKHIVEWIIIDKTEGLVEDCLQKTEQVVE